MEKITWPLTTGELYDWNVYVIGSIYATHEYNQITYKWFQIVADKQ